MSFVKIHGFELAQNAYAKNFIVERLATDPTVTDAGRIWFNTTSERFKVSILDGASVVVRSFRTLEELTSQVNGSSGTSLIGYDGQTGTNGQFSITAGALDGALDSMVLAIDANEQAISDIGTGSIQDLQDELDDTQTGAGLGADGAYTADDTSNYIKTADFTAATLDADLFNADVLLDAQVKLNEDAIAQEVSDRGDADTLLQSELDDTQTGAGLGTNGGYTADATTNYLKSTDFSGATLDASLFNADKLLDVAIKTNADAITTLDGDLTDGLALKVSKAGDTMTGNLNMSDNNIISLANPTADTDAANKFYVDSVAQGLIVKDSVSVATTENITLSGTQTIDGVAVVADDRVLVKNQTTATENGVYVVAAGAWTRAEDFDGTPTHEVKGGVFTFVQDGGTVTGNTGWVVVADGELALGTDDIVWTQFTGLGQIVAGAGIQKDGNVLSIGFGAGIIELPTDEVGLDLYSSSGLFLTEDGSTESLTTDGQLSVKLADTSLSLSATGLQISAAFSDNVDAIQTELDDTQAGAGLSVDGNYSAPGASNYLKSADFTAATLSESLYNADLLLDAQVKTNADNIATNVSDISTLQGELDDTQAGAGLGTGGGYTADEGSNYLKTTDFGATANLFEADQLLDAQIKVNELAIGTLIDDINGTVYTEASASAATHTITHSLASDFVEATVWVLDPGDGDYKNDLVAITILNNNSFQVDLTEARAIRVTVRAPNTIS